MRDGDAEAPSVRHGVARVRDQVQHHLLDLAPIGANQSALRCARADQVDVVTEEPTEHPLQLRHHCVQVDNLGRHDFIAAEREQLPREENTSLARNVDFRTDPRGRRPGVRILHKESRLRHDHAQEIVEIVRDAAGEHADRFHLLCMAELLFAPAERGLALQKRPLRAAAIRDVRRHADHALDVTASVADRRVARFERHLPDLDLRGEFLAPKRPSDVLGQIGVVGIDRVDRLADRLP